MIDDTIVIMVIEIRPDKVRLGIDAPKGVAIHREEVWEAIKRGESPGSALEESDTR